MSFWVIQRTYDLEYYDHNISFSGILTYASWRKNMSIDHIISEIYNSSIREVILIGDSTTLLDYGHQFMKLYMQWIVGHLPELCLIVIYIG